MGFRRSEQKGQKKSSRNRSFAIHPSHPRILAILEGLNAVVRLPISANRSAFHIHTARGPNAGGRTVGTRRNAAAQTTTTRR